MEYDEDAPELTDLWDMRDKTIRPKEPIQLELPFDKDTTMFDMKKNAGGNAGYKLVIHYNSKSDQYLLTGYTVHINAANRITTDQDGETLIFKTLEAAIAHITGYK
jgi:hypothetical protein